MLLFLKHPLIFKLFCTECQFLCLYGQFGRNIAFALPDIADFHIHTSRFLKEYLFERGALVVMNYDGSALVFTGIQHPLDHVTVGKMRVGYIKRAAFYLGLYLSFDIYPLGKSEFAADELVAVLVHVGQ